MKPARFDTENLSSLSRAWQLGASLQPPLQTERSRPPQPRQSSPANHPHTGPGAEGGEVCSARSGKSQQCSEITAVSSLKSADVLLPQS